MPVPVTPQRFQRARGYPDGVLMEPCRMARVSLSRRSANKLSRAIRAVLGAGESSLLLAEELGQAAAGTRTLRTNVVVFVVDFGEHRPSRKTIGEGWRRRMGTQRARTGTHYPAMSFRPDVALPAPSAAERLARVETNLELRADSVQPHPTAQPQRAGRPTEERPPASTRLPSEVPR
jgi:hypothetical protein